VGTGVSGLVVAHLLHREHEITLFEASEYVGGHVNTITVPSDDGDWEVDTGFIVYNELNYPNFTRLLGQLGVSTQASTMSFSVRSDLAGLEYNGSTIRQMFVQKRNLLRPSFYRMIRDILRFNREASKALVGYGELGSLGVFLRNGKYSEEFVDHYLAPMGSAIWSIPRTKVMEMPTEFFARFFENHGMLTVDDRPEWRVISGGSQRYVQELIRPFKHRIRLNSPVQHVRRHDDRVDVDGEAFDHVVLACHSDQALEILADADISEREILAALPYQENEVVLHTDTSLLPRRTAAWASWNYYLQGATDSLATVTYNMNMLQSLESEQTYCVTVNAGEALDPEQVLFRTRYHHPVYTEAGIEAQGRRSEISGVGRTHFCGAYWSNGFHEDGVSSALAVGATFGVSL
jgi:predicted NAD/FAD-binding protein